MATRPLKTIREDKVGSATLRVVETGGTYVGLIFGAYGRKSFQTEGENPTELWRILEREVGKLDPNYFGYDGALNRFRYFSPDSFSSARYVSSERQFKLDAKKKLDQTLPLKEAETASGASEIVMRVFQATTLLSPFEKTRLATMLRSQSGDAFVRAVSRFAAGDIRPALAELDSILRPFESAKWTVVTYLPYLWRPDAHMFLKPEVSKDFARRVGHAFRYEPRLNAEVYESLLEMTAETEQEIATLEPQDRIDVQSFIWVVGSYQEGKDGPA